MHEILLKNNRIILSFLFGLSGLLFFLLFLDSHYKEMKKAMNKKSIK